MRKRSLKIIAVLLAVVTMFSGTIKVAIAADEKEETIYGTLVREEEITDNTSTQNVENIVRTLVDPTPTPMVQERTVELKETEGPITVKLISVMEAESRAISAGYKEKTFIAVHDYYITEGLIERKLATTSSTYVMWDYGDKVHLRSRNHEYTYCKSGYSVSFIYGNLINTDGSVSYTSGDLCKIVRPSGNVEYYDIDATFTPEGRTYNCDPLS